jgi:HEAT repeat protein/beta-lactamase regulating signal transducer with metallopeptidase domain
MMHQLTLTSWLAAADAVVKATLLLGVAGIAALALRRASAATRHLVWTLALVSALVLPALSIALPRWHMPFLLVAAPEPVAHIVDAAVPAPRPSHASSEQPRPAAAAPVAAAQGRERHAADSFTVAQWPAVASTWQRISWAALVSMIWAAGFVLVAGRLLLGLVAVQWMSRRTERVADAPWLQVARELAVHIGVSRVAFLRSRRAAMPMAWGIVRPAVMMPADADEWPLERLRIVLLHELAHVKRRDCLTHVVAQLVCALYWFNPLAWMAARHVRTERERACDDLVLAAGTPGPDYAEELLEIARVMRGGRFPAVLAGASLAMAHRSQLEGRLIAILDPRIPRSGVSRLRTAIATALFTMALMPLASLQPWAYADAQVSEPNVGAVVEERNAPLSAPLVSERPADRQTATPQAQARTTASRDSAASANRLAEDPLQHTLTSAVDAAIEGVLDNVQPRQDASGKTTDPRLVAALTAALKDTDQEVRENALQALVQLRDPAVFEPLVQALADASADVREQAAFGLGQMRDRRAVQPLTGALKDSSQDVREQVVFALGQLRDPAAVDGLAAALHDSAADVREQAAFALGQIRDHRAVEPLISALKDANADVREQAAFALGQLRDRAAVEALVIALKDSVADVREQAAFALGQLRDPRAIDGLTTALKDPVASVRQQAAFALGQLAR